MSKACIDCGIDFLPSGHSARCLPCRRVWDSSWRLRRKAEGRPVRSIKMPREWFLGYWSEYYKDPEVMAKRAAWQRDASRNPERRPKYEARWLARRAIISGRLQRAPCEVCGSSKVDAHHDDYSMPLAVRWLCRTHHVEHHAKAEAQS